MFVWMGWRTRDLFVAADVDRGGPACCPDQGRRAVEEQPVVQRKLPGHIQGYLARKKQRPRRILQKGHMVVLGRWAVQIRASTLSRHSPWSSKNGQRSYQTATSKVSTGASKSLYQARPRTIAFLQKAVSPKPVCGPACCPDQGLRAFEEQPVIQRKLPGHM